jgi:UDP-galactopyranose mutase
MFKNYTYKQWEKYPHELDASVLARIPIRNNFDNRYFDDKYQGLPEKGYTHFIEKILDNKKTSEWRFLFLPCTTRPISRFPTWTRIGTIVSSSK